MVQYLREFACQAYVELELESTRWMNTKDCTKMATNQEYVIKILDIRYGLKIDYIIRVKDKDED